MINVEFKTYKYWDKTSAGSDEISISEIDPHDLYDWLQQPGSYLQGGYCISVLGEAWNGYWDEDEKSFLYYIDHIDGALNFLRTFNYFNSPHATIGETKSGIWQCDGSTMELSLIGPDMIMLKDEVFECEEMVTSLAFLSNAFQKATEEFQTCIKEVIALCPSDDPLRTDLAYQLEQTKKFALV
jgi:hypothetical protein